MKINESFNLVSLAQKRGEISDLKSIISTVKYNLITGRSIKYSVSDIVFIMLSVSDDVTTTKRTFLGHKA